MESTPRATEPKRTAAPLPRNVKLLSLASLLNDVASEMIVPSLPEFIRTTLKGTGADIGWIEGVADSANSVFKLYSGRWSDRSGRRKGWIVTGYAIAALARPLVALASMPWHVLATRSADRLGKGLRTAPRDAMIVESTEPGQRGRAFGFQRAMDHLGAALGPVVALAFLAIWPGRLVELFLLAVIPGAAVVALVALGLREPKHGSSAASVREDDARQTGDAIAGCTGEAAPLAGSASPGFRRYLAALLLFSLGNASDLFLLDRARGMGVNVQLLWLTFHLVKSSGNLLAGRAVDRFGARPLLTIGWLLYAAIYLAFGLADAAWQIWLLFLAYGVYYAFTESAEKTLVAQMGVARQMGSAYGWFNMIVGVAALPASVVFGLLYDYRPLAAFGWGAGLALAAVVVVLTLPRKSFASS